MSARLRTRDLTRCIWCGVSTKEPRACRACRKYENPEPSPDSDAYTGGWVRDGLVWRSKRNRLLRTVLDERYGDGECEGSSDMDGEIDPVVVERILCGDYRLASNRAERTEVCRRWIALGWSTTELKKATGWKVERYFKVGEDAA